MRRTGTGSLAALLCVAAAMLHGESRAAPRGAHAEGAYDAEQARVAATLLVHPDDRDRSAVRVGVLFDADPGWHLYWKNPGDSGLPTRLRWEVEGGEVEELRWPAPERFEEGDGLFRVYGYEDQVLIASEAWFSLPPPPETSLRVEVDVLVCKDQCIPANFTLFRTLGGDRGGERVRALFERFSERVPVAPDSAAVDLRGELDGEHLLLEISPCPSDPACDPGAWRTEFFPEADTGQAFAVGSATPHPNQGSVLLLPLARRQDASLPAALRGVLTLQPPDRGPLHLAVDLDLQRALARAGTAGLVAEQARGAPSLLHVLLLGFVGGLLLNLMPCVLPVLAIKVAALARLGAGRRAELIADGLAYTAGIEVTLLALAATVAALRAAGTAVGWGFQFQEPLFVVAVSALLVVFALNLFGVFEITASSGRLAELGQSSSGARRSFLEGLLAVLLATPCSAPFLGTAVGFAFASPVPSICAVFAAIGLGLAFPFAAISCAPGLARLLPRPGAWMLRLRTTLGFAVLLSVVWLLFVLGRTAGPDAVVTVLGFLVAVAFATWIYGCVRIERPLLKPVVGVAVLVLGVFGVSVIGVDPRLSPDLESALDAKPFERRELESALASGRGAFVYFTADWCITCKANERLVLRDSRVRDALLRSGALVFRGDWTRRDETIRAELARFGKAAVPLYLVYTPGSKQPIVLPELLTVDLVLAALDAKRPRPQVDSRGDGEGSAA